jgi:protein-S-isoprenylcysteine O-methyltransferase Ste14
VFYFLIPLLLGFAFNCASAFTTRFSRRWGERRGQQVTAILRNILGIPVWTIGLVLALRTPSAALFPSSAVVEIVAWVLLAAGCVIIGLALAALRHKAAMPSTRDTLVEHGMYARVRHPIHAGMLLVFPSLVLMHPTGVVALACAIGLGWVFAQTRFEELDLLERLPGYREYMNRVPRFVPRIGRR